MANKNNTFIQVPNDVGDSVALHRFLSRLVEQVDVAFGERSSEGFATVSSLETSSPLTTSVSTTDELSKNLASLTERLEVLEHNLKQPNIQLLASNATDIEIKINDIIESLKDANIVST